jgi:hypothetical protein
MLKMEATCSSGTSVDFQKTKRHYIPEDRTLDNHCRENLEMNMKKTESNFRLKHIMY